MQESNNTDIEFFRIHHAFLESKVGPNLHARDARRPSHRPSVRVLLTCAATMPRDMQKNLRRDAPPGCDIREEDERKLGDLSASHGDGPTKLMSICRQF